MVAWNIVPSSSNPQGTGLLVFQTLGVLGGAAVKLEIPKVAPHTYLLTGWTGQLGLPCVTEGAKALTHTGQAIYN